MGKAEEMKAETWLILNDIQIPFQDKPVLDLVLNFAAALRPQGVVLNGDIADCFSMSSHRRDPRELSQAGLQSEIDQVGRLMASFAKVPKKIYLGGNHEDRLYRYITDRAPDLGLVEGLDFPSIFKLKEHGFEWHGWGELIKLGRLYVTHGDIVRKHSAFTAKAHYEKYGASVLHGHTHRLGFYSHSNLTGVHGAWENGCLCRLDGLGYAHSPDWQQGFAVVHVASNGLFCVQQIPIIDRRLFFYGGKLWEGGMKRAAR